MSFTRKYYMEVVRIIQAEKSLRPASGNEHALSWDYFTGEALERMQEARRDDYYYRYLGHRGVVVPSTSKKLVRYQGQSYWSLEDV